MIKLVCLDIDGVITDGNLYLDEKGKVTKKINYKNIDAYFKLKNKYKIAFITAEEKNNEIIEVGILREIKRMFKPHYFQTGATNKAKVINFLQEKFCKDTNENINQDEICFVGDGYKDIEALEYAGLGICTNDSCNDVKKASNAVLNKKSGESLIYNVIDIIDFYNTTNHIMSAYIDLKYIYGYHDIVFKNLLNDKIFIENLELAFNLIRGTIINGNKIFFCGNGGSAADSQHVTAELVNMFDLKRKSINAESLTTDTSVLTAIANDFSFDDIFKRQIEGKGKANDILFGITTSGQSKNILKAFIQAEKQELTTILLTGKHDRCMSKLLEHSKIVLSVPIESTPRIQEIHICILHLLCERIDQEFSVEGND